MIFKTNISAIILATLCAIFSLSVAMAAASDSVTPVTPSSELTDTDDIRPIRGEVPIPEPETSTWPTTLLQIALILIAIVAVTLLIIWIKRRAEARRIPNLQQKALDELSLASALITDQQQSREYSIVVSDIVRNFLALRFKLPVTQQTTQEFISELSTASDPDLGPYQTSLSHFLEQSDFGKFSGDHLATSDMETLQQAAVEVVSCESITKNPNHDLRP